MQLGVRDLLSRARVGSHGSCRPTASASAKPFRIRAPDHGVRAAGLHYPRSVHGAASLPAKPRGLALMLGWRRIRFTLAISIACGLLLPYGWSSGLLRVITRTVVLGLVAMLMFGLFEQWPKRLPRWLERWVLQVVSVALAMP